jgi:hypothetical protein
MKKRKTKKYNFNALAVVTLTPYGVSIVKKKSPHNLKIAWRFNPKTKEYTDELWSLMADFGDCLWMGNKDVPFEKGVIAISEET